MNRNQVKTQTLDMTPPLRRSWLTKADIMLWVMKGGKPLFGGTGGGTFC